MTRLFRRRTKTVGLPPGTPVYVGETRPKKTRIRIINFDEQGVEERVIEEVNECSDYTATPTVSWIKVEGLATIDKLTELCQNYSLHPLVVEDILNTTMRPKIEDFGEYVFILFKILNYSVETGVTVSQASIILTAEFVISFQEGDGDVFAPVMKRIRAGKGMIREMQSDYLVYSLLDVVVDHYFQVIEKIEKHIEQLEDELIENPTKESLHMIHLLKERVIALRTAIRPMREVAIKLERGTVSLIEEPVRVYFHDINENIVQISESIETFRDKVPVMFEIYYASVSHRTNEVIKVLTIIATIFLPLSLLVSIFGITIPISPLIAIPITIVILVVMLLYLRHKDWL
ncbi:MAG: magnesium/cobalt transporter CorA [Candidatus Hodarchaeota archaeon]